MDAFTFSILNAWCPLVKHPLAHRKYNEFYISSLIWRMSSEGHPSKDTQKWDKMKSIRCARIITLMLKFPCTIVKDKMFG